MSDKAKDQEDQGNDTEFSDENNPPEIHQSKSIKVGKKTLHLHKWHLIGAAIIIVGGAIGVFFLINHGNRNNQLPTVQAQKTKSVSSQSLSAKPGTYLTLQTDPSDIKIDGIELCKNTTQLDADEGISCQLNDDYTTITFTAPHNTQKNGKSYAFAGWSGCTDIGDNPAVCTINVVKGAHIKVKASFELASDTSDNGPSIAVKIDGFSSGTGSLIWTPTGQKSATLGMELVPSGVTLSDCTVTDNVVNDDDTFSTQTVSYKPLASQNVSLVDGLHTITASCTSGATKVSSTIRGTIGDNMPKKCSNFNFTDGASTATSLESLKSGIIGQWEGCVTTPWMPAYFVTIEFKSDGTYTATGNEVLDGRPGYPMYYGGQQSNPSDKYDLTNFQSNNTGIGTFNIYFDLSGSVVQEDMKDIKLSGNSLSFDFKHFGTYGPLVYQLHRK